MINCTRKLLFSLVLCSATVWAQASQPLPTPLAAAAPLGSMVYSSPFVGGMIASAGSSESYTVALYQGQVISLDLITGRRLQGTITCSDPNGNIIASATAPAVGQEVLLQTVPVSSSGTYTITVAGANSTTGDSWLKATLNAALDISSHGGSNETLGTAQDITGAFRSLTFSSQMAAVAGKFSGTSSRYFSFPESKYAPFTVALSSARSASGTVTLLDGEGNVLATGASGPTNLSSVINQYAAVETATYYVEVSGTGTSSFSLIVTRSATFEQEKNDTAAAAQHLYPAPTVMGYVGKGGSVPANDWYVFYSNAGDNDVISTVTFATPTSGLQFPDALYPQVEVFDPNLNLVASNVGQPINTSVYWTALSTGSYYVHVYGFNQTVGEYVLQIQGATGFPQSVVLPNNVAFP